MRALLAGVLAAIVVSGAAVGGSTGSTAVAATAPEEVAAVPSQATLSVSINVAQRVTAADQFSLEVRSASGAVAGSIVTAGSDEGVQSEMVGAIPTETEARFTLTQAGVDDTDLSEYQTSLECVIDGSDEPFFNATGSVTSDITIPAAAADNNVTCAVTNAPVSEVDAPTAGQQQAGAADEATTTVDPSKTEADVPTTDEATTQEITALALGPVAVCTADYAYALLSNGTVRQYAPTGTPTVTDFGGWTVSGPANGLSISADGSTMYAFVQGGMSNLGISSILRYSADTGIWESIPGSSFTRTTGSALISGAISPVNGRYVFGGYSGSTFQLYEYDPVANTFRTLGTIATAGQTLGDMTFDSAGNLYIAAVASTTMTMYTVLADTIAAASGGTLARTAANTKTLGGTPTMTNSNGIAFRTDGTMYVSNAGTLAQFDPTTGTRIAGSTVTVDGGNTITDLASCEPPVTMTLQKNITSRFTSTDQFALSIRNTNSTVVATGTTTGTATGLQAVQVGPTPVVRNTSYQVVEASSGGSLTNYASSYSCTSAGTVIASGQTTTSTVTTPNVAGAAMTCVYTNTPLTASVVVHKTITDFYDQNPVPGVGWTLGANSVATTGTVTRTPAAATQVSNASGDANWSLRFSTAASRATVTVSETQKPGYVLASGSCTVTSVDGSTRTVALPTAQGAAVTGVAPGDTVSCTMTNKPVSATCDVNAIYGLDRATPSDIWSIDPSTAQITSIVATSTGTTTLTNALAVGAGFQEFWFVDQTSGASQTSAIVYHVVGGVTTAVGTVTDIKTPNGAFIMGAYNPATGVYYFGTLSQDPAFPNQLYIYGYNTFTNQPIVGSVGRVQLPAGAFNGDFVFDSAGRLFVVTDGALVVVTDAVPTTGSTTPPLLQSRVISNLGAVAAPNAVAFGPDGYLYVGAGAATTGTEQIAKVNPASGAVVGTWASLSPTSNSIRDFASCASPQVIRLQKDLPDGRIASTDQFALAVTGGGLSVGNTGLTTGTETGIQNQEFSEIAGPVIGLGGTTYTITESASGTTNLGSYATTWVCVDETTGTQLASGSGSTGQFTSPPANGNGANILCTFTNRIPVHEIELVKVEAGSPSTTLAGAKFQLWRDVNGNGMLEPGTDTTVGAEQTTSVTGVISWTTGLTAGNYLIQETAAPPGYEIVAPAVHAVTLGNTKVTITVENTKRTGTVTWSKTDSSGTALRGSEWALVGPTGAGATTVIDCIGATAADCANATDKDQRAGYFTVGGLAWGSYTLTETAAPAGFVLDPTAHSFSIGITSPAQLQVDLGAIVNQRQPPLVIPLTGGMGADWFLLGGGLLLAVLLALIVIRHRRGRRFLKPSPTNP